MSTLCCLMSSRSFWSRAVVLTVSISIALRVAVVEKLRRFVADLLTKEATKRVNIYGRM